MSLSGSHECNHIMLMYFWVQLPSLQSVYFGGTSLPDVSKLLTCVDASIIHTLGIDATEYVSTESISPFISTAHRLHLTCCMHDLNQVERLFSAFVKKGFKS